jgi:hypothetical protein
MKKVKEVFQDPKLACEMFAAMLHFISSILMMIHAIV